MNCQLFNVFKGDISIVGPRPCVSYEPGEYETLNKKYKKRFQVRVASQDWRKPGEETRILGMRKSLWTINILMSLRKRAFFLTLRL